MYGFFKPCIEGVHRCIYEKVSGFEFIYFRILGGAGELRPFKIISLISPNPSQSLLGGATTGVPSKQNLVCPKWHLIEASTHSAEKPDGSERKPLGQVGR